MIDFIIIGAQKGGTTAAAYNLNKHPNISVFSGVTEYGKYEIEFFNHHWEKGNQWYFDQLPTSKGIRGEKTAELLHRTICHERIFTVQPNVKLLALLRCPIKRAYSHWKMASYVKLDEFRSFDQAISEEIKIIDNDSYREAFYSIKDTGIRHHGYIMKGFYYDQLNNLFKYFRKENVHIAISEQVIKNRIHEYNKMFSFLNVAAFEDQFEDRFIGQSDVPISNQTLAALKNIYSSPNLKLFNMIGYEIPDWINI